MLGTDFSLDFSGDSTLFSDRFLLLLPTTIDIQIENDLDPGEVEHFVLELSDAEIVGQGVTYEVLIANSLTVNIIDDDGKCHTLFSYTFKLQIFCIVNSSASNSV